MLIFIFLKSSVHDPDSFDLQDFGFLDPDPRGKMKTKNCLKNIFLILNPKLNKRKREIIKV